MRPVLDSTVCVRIENPDSVAYPLTPLVSDSTFSTPRMASSVRCSEAASGKRMLPNRNPWSSSGMNEVGSRLPNSTAPPANAARSTRPTTVLPKSTRVKRT